MEAGRFKRLAWWLTGLVAIVLVGGGAMLFSRGTLPNLPTGEVTRGDFIELVEVRGDVRPFRSVVVVAPFQAGELQILKIAPSGTAVKQGDVVAEFDALTLRNTIQDKQGELRQAEAERDQAREQAKSDAERDRTAVLKAEFDVKRERLNIGDPSILSASDVERTRLAVADAEQRLTETQAKDAANRRSAAADAASRDRKIAKIQNDIEIAKRGFDSLKVVAPADGTVSVMSNYRMSGPMGMPQEFKQGDRAWPGAQILELPDLSSVRIMSRIDETDRGQLKLGQTAIVRAEAVPDREYHATVTDISMLARIDYSSWPAVKNFDLVLSITDADARLRPGMSSSVRIATGKVPDMLLVPSASVFPAEGRLVVYRRGRRSFEPVAVEIIKRGRDQIAIKGAVSPGDRISLVKPPEDNSGKGRTP